MRIWIAKWTPTSVAWPSAGQLQMDMPLLSFSKPMDVFDTWETT